jgi:glycine cleavage system H protein
VDEFRPPRPGLRYTPDHLWLRREGGAVVVGVTDRVSRILTLVTSVELPAPGARLEAGEELATIESQKTTVTVQAPCPLEVLEANPELPGDPMLVRLEPYGRGWLVRVRLAEGAWARLLDERRYRAAMSGGTGPGGRDGVSDGQEGG